MVEATAKPRAGRYRFFVAALTFVSEVALGINFVGPAAMFPLIMASYGVNRATVSLLVSSVTLMRVILLTPTSVIAAKVGIKRAYSVGVFLMAAGLLTPLAVDFPMLLATRILYGVGSAVVMPLVGAVVVQWFDSRELPLVNSLNVVGSSLGATISMFATVLVAQSFGWEAPLALYGWLAMACFVAWALFGRERRDAQSALQSMSLREMTWVLRQKSTLLLGMGMMGAFGLYMGLNSWLPTYYSQVKGMPLATASAITGLLPFWGIVGSLLGGVLPAWLGLRRPFIMISGSVTALAALGTYLSPNLPLTYFSISLMGVSSWLFMPAAFTIMMELPDMTPERVGVMLATALAMGNLSVSVSPLIIGYLADLTDSYLPGFLLWNLGPLANLAAGFLLPETGPRARATPPVVEEVVAAGEDL